jgi:NAD(P)-dependent dehydrogenase (short-subunit alcohol dehydrogenase family)
MTSELWTLDSIPDQHGQLVLITGGNSGLGFEAGRALAGKGAHVILTARDAGKGQAAAEAIRREHPQATVAVMALDLADLSSVRLFAADFQKRFSVLPRLINNAGVMATPYQRTKDGFELQFGTNHLVHFALTGLLLPSLLAAPKARVVTVSSGVHERGAIAFDNLDGSRRYDMWAAYGQSKLANVLFAYELQRCFQARGLNTISLACHPGYAGTNLQSAGPRLAGSRLRESLMGFANRFLAQPAAMGALPLLYAAVEPTLRGGEYIGPLGAMGMRGYPGLAASSARSHDAAAARRLWEISETLTGIRYDFSPARTPLSASV